VAAVIAGGFWLVRERATRERVLAEETLLRAELAAMRASIQRYAAQHGRPPRTLAEAMPQVPVDPVTRSAATWKTTTEERVAVDDFSKPTEPSAPGGIVDVRSGAAGRDSRGRPWSDY
jgi:general secretion pathway protein G